MSQITETICDQCGEKKGKSNHWFSLFTGEIEYRLLRERNHAGNDIKDICSQQCATRALQEFMSPDKLSRTVAEEMYDPKFDGGQI